MTPSSSQRPQLLFATIAAGGGHIASAKAMAQAIEAQYPNQFEISILDYMHEIGPRRFDQQHKHLWKQALRFPVSARLGQRLIDSLPALSRQVQHFMLREFSNLASSDLRIRQPDLVISNHGLITTGLVQAQKRHGLRVPVLTFATEPHNISAYWAEPEAELILTPNTATTERLKRMGVPTNRLKTVGYPIQQSCLNPPSRQTARAELELDERFTILVSLGGEGIGGNPLTLVRQLSTQLPDIMFVVICGRNEVLRQDLGTLQCSKLRALGYVDNMASYLAASDLVVAKAGPASVYEALAVGRPVLITSFAGLNEQGVRDFIVDSGLGSFCPTAEQLMTVISQYQQQPETIRHIEERCKALELQKQTRELAESIVDYYRQNMVMDQSQPLYPFDDSEILHSRRQ